MTDERLCQCKNSSECQFELVQQTGGKTFELCQTSARHRAAFFKMDKAARNQKTDHEPTTKERKKRIRGIGDVVSSVTTAIGIKPCGGCKKRAAVLNHYVPAKYRPVEPLPYTGDVKRNLIYHIWPNNEDVWKWNVEHLLSRWEMFNGKRVIGIAVSKESDEAAVRAMFPDDTQFIVSQNNPKLGEMVNFVKLLESVESLDENEITFYAHAKGTKYSKIEHRHDGIRLWANAMYECLLDYPQSIEYRLSHKAMVGLFSMSANFRGFPKRLEHHYSGTFYWFRNAHVYERNWRYTHNSYYGSEMWPGLLFKSEDVHALMPLPKTKILQMYSARFWERSLSPLVARWKNTHRHLHKDYHEPPKAT